MKEIQLVRGYVAQVDDEDYEYLSQWKWCVKEGKYTVYAIRSVQENKKMKRIWMHRLILNVPSDLQVDHIDGNGLNNQKNNLRECTSSQNNMNKRASGFSKYLGVTFVTTPYSIKHIRSRININGKDHHLGLFKTEEDAARAYDLAAIQYHGEFAHLNFPEKKAEYIIEINNQLKTA